MNFKDYVAGVKRTENQDYRGMVERFNAVKMVRLSHAAAGLTTEAAEFQDSLKKTLYYGKLLDSTNLTEELGDLLYYIAMASDALDISFEQLMEVNLKKLETRYGSSFSSEAALNRNLDAELEVLKNGQ